MAAAAEARLSGLPDDLLRRVLRFAPAKEAVSTSFLSRRWRSLWRSSGAVNLETRVHEHVEDRVGGPHGYNYYPRKGGPAFFRRRDGFVSTAKALLAAAGSGDGDGGPVTRLSVRLECESSDLIQTFLYDDGQLVDVLADLLSHPAARGVEELQLSAAVEEHAKSFIFMDCEADGRHDGFRVALSLLHLPSNTLRALDVAGLKALAPPPAGFALPRLESVRLRRCGFPLEHLQGLIDTAPALAVVRLESVVLEQEDGASPLHLRCPAATTLVLDKCCWAKEDYHSRGSTAVVIEAPRLRWFTYKGFLREISLNPQAPDLARVDLHILPQSPYPDRTIFNKNPRRATFWRLIHTFSNVREELKLSVNHLEDIAAATAAEKAELLRPFGSLKRLELQGVHMARGPAAAVAIANLLQCCPVIHDLRINLTTTQGESIRKCGYGSSFLKRKYRS